MKRSYGTKLFPRLVEFTVKVMVNETTLLWHKLSLCQVGNDGGKISYGRWIMWNMLCPW